MYLKIKFGPFHSCYYYYYYYSYFNVNVLAGTFNQEKALVGAFCVIEKLLSKGSFSSSNTTYNVTQCGDTDKDPREYMGKGQCL